MTPPSPTHRSCSLRGSIQKSGSLCCISRWACQLAVSGFSLTRELTRSARFAGHLLPTTDAAEHHGAEETLQDAQVRGVPPMCVRSRSEEMKWARPFLPFQDDSCRLRPDASCALSAVFTNVLRDSLLQDLADADDGEVVKQVQASMWNCVPALGPAGLWRAQREGRRCCVPDSRNVWR